MQFKTLAVMISFLSEDEIKFDHPIYYVVKDILKIFADMFRTFSCQRRYTYSLTVSGISGV